MRYLAMLTASAVIALSFLGHSVQAQSVVTAKSTTYVCPKCGKVHTHPISQPVVSSNSSGVVYSSPTTYSAPAQTIAPASYNSQTYAQPVAQSYVQPASTGGTQNVLQMLNSQRARQGLRSLRYDSQLQAVAQRRVQMMASSGTKTHPPGSFAPGRFEGVGWSSSYSPNGVYACYTSDPNMTAAGAAMARGRDGVYFAVVYR